MVLHGVREFTHDIDIGCEHDVAEALIRSGCRTSRFPDGGVKIQFDDVIEVYENSLKDRDLLDEKLLYEKAVEYLAKINDAKELHFLLTWTKDQMAIDAE